LGTTWKNPSVTLVEGKGKAIPVHRKKKYYNTPRRRVLFKKLTIIQSVRLSPPFTEPEASSPYSHGPGPLFPAQSQMYSVHTLTPNFFRIRFTIIFTCVSRVSSSL
jgi:hypothetical protein